MLVCMYVLIGVICHSGTLHDGHYISNVKRNDQWFCCNDERVSPVSEAKVLSEGKQAYVLMYSKKESGNSDKTKDNNNSTPSQPSKPPLPKSTPAASTPKKQSSSTSARPVPNFVTTPTWQADLLPIYRVYNGKVHHYTLNFG